MAKTIEQFTEHTKKVTEGAGVKWDDLTPEKQELAIAYMMKLYYEKHPDEAKEILEGEE